MEKNIPNRITDKEQKYYLAKEKKLDDYFFPNKGILNPEQAKEFLRVLTEEDPIRVKLGIAIIKD